MISSILFGFVLFFAATNIVSGLNYSSDFKSDLPIILLNSDHNIPEGYKSIANLTVIFNGNDNYFKGKADIAIHGASSWNYPQRSITLETKDINGANYKFPFFGFPKEKKWFLITHYNDKSLMRNALSLELYSRMGKYSPRYKHCEVFLNNVYAGVYLFVEKIMPGNHRVNITKMKQSDNSGVQLTGGYIWKFDVGYYKFLPHYPSANKITKEQNDYLFEQFLPQTFSTLWTANDTTRAQLIDEKSFIDYFLLEELSANVDAFKKSRFFYKDRDDKDPKIYAGPVWDFDWAWKYIWTEGIPYENNGLNWLFKFIDPCCYESHSMSYETLFKQTNFAIKTRDQWFSYRQNVYSKETLFEIIESYYHVLHSSGAAQRHFELFPVLGVQGPSVEKYRPLATTYRGEVDNLRNFVSDRLQFIDHNITSILNLNSSIS